VGPLAIYLTIATVLIALSIAVRIWRHTPMRKCHLCGGMVELGRRRCPTCGYEFIN
jgi:rRNA maturation endonuclease Nob1